MVRILFRSVHRGTSWCILETPRQPIQICSGLRPISVRSKPVSSTGRVYKPSQEQTRFLHRCWSSQDLRLCFCSTFEQLANFWLRYSQSNSSFWNASSHWGRDLYNWWWKNGIVYCLLLYYKVQKLWSENTKIKIPENEENESVPYQLFEKRYQWHHSCVYYLTELKKKLNPQLKKTSWEKIFF